MGNFSQNQQLRYWTSEYLIFILCYMKGKKYTVFSFVSHCKWLSASRYFYIKSWTVKEHKWMMAFGASMKVWFLKNISLSSGIHGYFIRVFFCNLYSSLCSLFLYHHSVRKSPEIETKSHKLILLNTGRYRCLLFEDLLLYMIVTIRTHDKIHTSV